MLPPDELDDADAAAQPGARSVSDVRMGPAARDALLRVIAHRIGAEKLRAIGITVPDERRIGGNEEVPLVSAAHTTDWLIEMARLDRGLKELAALATEGRSEVALIELARLLTQR